MTYKGPCLSSDSEEWETPQDFFNEMDREFNFTLDVCATKQNAKCIQYFDKEQDGLKQEWLGNVVWCNPPYGRKYPKWVEKGLYWKKHGVTSVFLIPARTDTILFHDVIEPNAEIRFIRGRLKFGGGKDPAPFPSMLVIFRGDTE